MYINICILYLKKLIYGKYSSQYYDYYTLLKEQYPYSLVILNMKINNSCIDGSLREHIVHFNKNKNIKPVLKTEKDIIFNNNRFFVSSKEIIKIKGDPDYFETFRLEKALVKLFGYDNNFLNLESKEIYYFVDDIFFMGEYIVSTGQNTNYSDIHINYSGILKKLQKEYNVELSGDPIEFKIVDKFNSSIIFSDNIFQVYLKYFSLQNSYINTVIDNVLKTEERKFENLSKIKENKEPIKAVVQAL